MKTGSEILNEIMFFILERAKYEENKDKYLEHVLDNCKKYYQKAFKKQNVLELTIDELKYKYEQKGN